MNDKKNPSGEPQTRGRVTNPPPKPAQPAAPQTSREKLGRVVQPPPPNPKK